MEQLGVDQEKELKENTVEESSGIVLRTPQKTDSPARTEIASTEMYKDILDSFDGMVCSIRLLKLCGKVATFENVRTQVEVLKKRKLLHRHLAQIKYVLSEEVQVNKILVHDRTLCVRPSVKISLSFTGIALRELFISRIVDFFTKNPKVRDIPEAILPELFCQGGEMTDQEFLDCSPTIQPQPTISPEKPQASQLVMPLKRIFSKESDINGSGLDCVAVGQRNEFSKEETQGEQDVDSMKAEFDAVIDKDNVDALDAKPDVVHDENGRNDQGEGRICCEQRTHTLFPLEGASQTPVAASVASDSPTVKPSPSLVNSIVDTPAQLTPKRSMSCCDSNEKITSIQNILSSHKNAKRSLDFSSDEVSCNRNKLEESENCFNIPDERFQAPEPMELKDIFGAPVSLALSMDKDKLSKVRKDSETMFRHSKQMPSCLPGIVSTICHVYQMTSYSSITKEDLVHKILVNDLEITERKDAEEQIELLEKLVPDWIWKTSIASGDIMYSINKVAHVESVLSRLSETIMTADVIDG
ncbi:hypothetical protein MLD38_032882 [Melastoma candidum]|uniref:Uncharacterized protein n=1 Tax=Melastoma candidum TaxID=119954 RepID=A0ACB9M4P9_9MYRT|nr:hypothetical protein MLD38_032882 [Melastoma candidum]